MSRNLRDTTLGACAAEAQQAWEDGEGASGGLKCARPYAFPNARYPHRKRPMSHATLWSAFRASDIPPDRRTQHGFRSMAQTIIATSNPSPFLRASASPAVKIRGGQPLGRLGERGAFVSDESCCGGKRCREGRVACLQTVRCRVGGTSLPIRRPQTLRRKHPCTEAADSPAS